MDVDGVRQKPAPAGFPAAAAVFRKGIGGEGENPRWDAALAMAPDRSAGRVAVELVYLTIHHNPTTGLADGGRDREGAVFDEVGDVAVSAQTARDQQPVSGPVFCDQNAVGRRRGGGPGRVAAGMRGAGQGRDAAGVRRVKRTVEPGPASLSTPIGPPSRWARRSQIARPRPLPP